MNNPAVEESKLHFTPDAKSRAIIEEASEVTDIDSFINLCIAKHAEATKTNETNEAN